MNLFNAINRKLSEHFYTEQLSAFFSWLRKENNCLGTVYVYLPTVQFHSDHNRKHRSDMSNVGFIICDDETKTKAFAEIAETTVKADWSNIFYTPFFQIWENRSLHNVDNLPLRFGLKQTEKEFIIAILRDYLSHTIGGVLVPQKPLTPLSPRFLQITDLDVTLWVKGKLRGSIVLSNQPLLNGLKSASSLASKDFRFKPISPQELKDMVIEITLISPLRVPLLQKEVSINDIYFDKAYRLSLLNKEGWYLPVVFNCRTFTNLKDLISNLLVEKLDLSQQINTPIPTISQTEIFISHTSTDKVSDISLLSGPLPVSSSKSLANIQIEAVSYLANVQEEDGNLLAVINPLQNQVKQFDLVRLAHATWSLLQYGNFSDYPLAKKVGGSSYSYLMSLLNNYIYLRDLNIYERSLCQIYTYRASELLDDTKVSKFLKNNLSKDETKMPDEPILKLQYIQHLINLGSPVSLIEEQTNVVLSQFDYLSKNNLPISLAAYVDLLVCLDFLVKATKNTYLETRQAELIDWYINKQKSDGSFPNTTQSSYAYTRGTLKILESLSNLKNQPTLNTDPLPWLTSMQYTESTTYFVDSVWQKRILGGLRHDAHNATVWIDSVGHILLVKRI